MADRGVKSNNSAKQKNTNINKSKALDLKSREEEYKRLNEELEAKTADLVREAEQVMRGQDHIFSAHSMLDNISQDDFLQDESDEEEDIQRKPAPSQPTSSRPASSRPTSKMSNQSQKSARTNKRLPSAAKTNQKTTRTRVADDVAVPDEAIASGMRDLTFDKAISNIENRLEEQDYDDIYDDDDDDDVMPTAATEMGSEAQIRFLKAKLRVMQEELDRLAAECNKKDDENSSLVSRLKDAEEERGRLSRTSASQQSQIDKYKRLADDARGKAESLETQISNLRKELDTLKRSQKQQVSSQGATEVRLNRALEEVEKYKAQLQKARTESKDSSTQDKRKTEQLMAENKRLEKQKNELMAGFKKQLKLIDILKRQKMHIEAARVLAFTEEEFVKALEWGN